MKIITIGDIHGRTKGLELAKQNLDADLIIFLGDYVDHWTYSNVQIKDNLLSIIQFKKDFPDKVILLWGNHCLQYLFTYSSHGCSGFRAEAYWDLHEIFNKERELFQAAYQHKNYLWTHAGMSNTWYVREYPYTPLPDKIAESLNEAFLHNEKRLFDVGYLRGGYAHEVGGIFWADRRETQPDMVPGLHQIVGHTKIEKIRTFYLDNVRESDTSITYCDDENKDVYVLNFD